MKHNSVSNLFVQEIKTQKRFYKKLVVCTANDLNIFFVNIANDARHLIQHFFPHGNKKQDYGKIFTQRLHTYHTQALSSFWVEY